MTWYFGPPRRMVNDPLEQYRNWIRSHLAEIVRNSTARAELERIPSATASAAISAITPNLMQQMYYDFRSVETYLLSFTYDPNDFLKEVL